MARTANRHLKTETDETEKTRVYRAGSYLRLSLDSDHTGSDSLENQRRLAAEHAKDLPDVEIVKEYVDDGRSGMTFERPAFFRMIGDLKGGTIDCVLVKDLSRFGREYIEAGNYIEKVFPFLGTRFISIVDGYDSADPNCGKELLVMALKNLMHEMYARDLSQKVGTMLRAKQETGEFYHWGTIPYGYKMNESGTNYCVDEQAAVVVKEIFSRYGTGDTRYKIIRWLYQSRISPPQQYRRTGKVRQADDIELKVWPSISIQSILANPIYIGNVVRHKTEKSLFAGQKQKCVPKAEQVLIIGNHPAIIDENLFRNVQERLRESQAQHKAHRKNSITSEKEVNFDSNIFYGKIFCGDCKAIMARIGAYRKIEGKRVLFQVFKCSARLEVKERCSNKRITERDLCEAVRVTIQKQLCLMKATKKKLDEGVKGSVQGYLSNIDHERKRIRNRQVMLQQEYMRAYDQHVSRKISEEAFQEFRKSYQQRNTSLQAQAKKLDEKEKKAKAFQTSVRKMFQEWFAFGNARQLTRDMVERCVERIEVFHGNRLEIRLRYQDCFQELEERMERGDLRR